MKWRVPDQRGLGERLSKKDCEVLKLNMKDAMDRSRWRKLTKGDDKERCEWVNVSSGTSSPR